MKKIFFALCLAIAANLSAQPALNLICNDVQFAAGDTVDADFLCTGMYDLSAFQFCLVYNQDKLEHLGYFPSPANPIPTSSDDCSIWPPKPQELRHVYTTAYGFSAPDYAWIFSHKFVAKQAGILSHEFQLATWPLYLQLYPVCYDQEFDWGWVTLEWWNAFSNPVTTSAPVIRPEIAMNAYPNPCFGSVNITLAPTFDQEAAIFVYDTSGRVISEGYKQVGPTSPIINVPLGAGTWFVKVATDEGQSVVKVVSQ